MYDIQEYLTATTLEEATALLAAHPDLTIIAGGTDVLIKMHHGQGAKARLMS